MAINPLLRSNPTRMMGMASGMDTESIIQATLRMHQFKIDNAMRNKKLIEWKQSIHNDVKSQISALRSTYLSNLGSKSMMSRNAFNANVATITAKDGRNVSAVSVSGTVNASTGSMKIGGVLSLAKGASFSSTYSTTNYPSGTSASVSGNGFTSGTTLENLDLSAGALDFGQYKADITTTSGKTEILKSQVDGEWGTDWTSTFKISQDDEVTITREGTAGNYKFIINGLEGGPQEISGDGTHSISHAGGNITADFVIDGDKLSFSVKDGDNTVIKSTPAVFTQEKKFTAGNGDEVTLKKSENGNISYNGASLNFYGEATITISSKAGTDEFTDSITLRSNMSLAEMVSAFNNSKAGVTMTYDRMQDKFTLETKKYGDNTELSIDDAASRDFLSKLFGDTALTSPAANGDLARVLINDEIVTRDTNSFDFRGVNVKLNEITGDIRGTDAEMTVTVKRDADKAVNAIKDFIDSYNAIIKKLEDLLNERKTSSEASYKPLTDEEKAVMTEKQIEDWEAIAKKGILRNDRGISDLVSSLRASFFEQIEGTGLTPSQIGLSTGSYFGNTGGQILIDEDKLRAAIEADPDRVADVFIKIDNSNGLKGVGLLHKIDNLMRDFVNTTQFNSLDALEKSLAEANERIAKMEERMWAEEDKLYRQFAAMETALSKMQSQGDWFAAMLGTA